MPTWIIAIICCLAAIIYMFIYAATEEMDNKYK
jgi:uncharacterized membrane protein